MPSNCTICGGIVSRHKEFIKCVSCDNSFHTSCIKSSIQGDPGKFVCPSCAANTKMGDSSKPPLTDIVKMLGKLDSKIDALQADLNIVKSQQTSVQESLEFYGAKIDDFNKKIVEFETKLKVIPKLEISLSSVTDNFNNLQSEVDHLQQQVRMFNLEINGIPEKSGEFLLSVVKKIFHKFEIPDDIIESCHRVAHMDSKNKAPRSIIVKLSSRIHKNNIISAVRKNKGLKLGDIDISVEPGQNDNIFINDHLTPKNKLLLKKTKEFCKSLNATCWTHDCKIYVKHLTSGTIYLISNENALKKIK